MSDVVRWGEQIQSTADESVILLRAFFLATRSIIAFVIIFAVNVALIVFRKELTSVQAVTMSIVAVAHLGWSTLRTPSLAEFGARFTTRKPVATRLQTEIQGSEAEPARSAIPVRRESRPTGFTTSLRHPGQRVWLYLIVQGALATVAICSTGGSQAILLLWLLLLPSATDATLLLRRWGIFFVAVLCMLVNLIGLVRAFGWQASHAAGVIQFGLSFVFVVVVTEIAVRSVKTRQEAIRLEHELGLANIRLRRYAVQAEEIAAARERYRIAREIHDTIGHALTVVSVQLEVALTMLDRDLGMARDAIGKSQSMIREGLQEIRESVSELRSSPIDNRSLVDALRQVVTEVDTLECPVALEILGDARELTEKAHLCLFRAGQECVTNSKRHSSATRISVTLDFRRADTVSLTVTDNGRGTANLEEGFGLIGIRERSLEVGGEVSIVTSVGQGFEMTIGVCG